ncbi:MAG: hypothetical protein M9952_04465 [Microthrixaceae bacterium]|nr:hypothetical protein [Microthrixaceae bacterium]
MSDDIPTDRASAANDAERAEGAEEVRLFGDPRSGLIDRRSPGTPTPEGAAMARRATDIDSGVRLNRGTGFATFLLVSGWLLFGATLIAGGLIIYNAQEVGAFSNPWNSTRLAVGIAVLSIGLTQSILMIALSLVMTQLQTLMRFRFRDAPTRNH